MRFGLHHCCWVCVLGTRLLLVPRSKRTKGKLPWQWWRKSSWSLLWCSCSISSSVKANIIDQTTRKNQGFSNLTFISDEIRSGEAEFFCFFFGQNRALFSKQSLEIVAFSRKTFWVLAPNMEVEIFRQFRPRGGKRSGLMRSSMCHRRHLCGPPLSKGIDTPDALQRIHKAFSNNSALQHKVVCTPSWRNFTTLLASCSIVDHALQRTEIVFQFAWSLEVGGLRGPWPFTLSQRIQVASGPLTTILDPFLQTSCVHLSPWCFHFRCFYESGIVLINRLGWSQMAESHAGNYRCRLFSAIPRSCSKHRQMIAVKSDGRFSLF